MLTGEALLALALSRHEMALLVLQRSGRATATRSASAVDSVAVESRLADLASISRRAGLTFQTLAGAAIAPVAQSGLMISVAMARLA